MQHHKWCFEGWNSSLKSVYNLSKSDFEKMEFATPNMGQESSSNIIWGDVWKDYGTVTKIAESDGPVECPLLDLSSGGASFLFHSSDYFKVGEEVSIVAQNKMKSKTIYIGKVISIKIFDQKDSTFSVSIRF
jgi:hypothetical protein